MNYLVFFLQKSEFLLLCCICHSQHIPKGHILKAFSLSNIIIWQKIQCLLLQTNCKIHWKHHWMVELTVWNVDSCWDATTSKGEHIQRGEIRFEEAILFERSWPGQLRQQDFGWTYQLCKPGTHRLIHHSNKTWGEGAEMRRCNKLSAALIMAV